ncbi:MAG: MmgE/PrpD family protein [Betaproteobacteria bacterium]|nr:MmgE/PrpD family protein [Betaproteobacteria bacterium]
MGLTQEICRIIQTTGRQSLDETCVHRVKQAIKDGVAVALAGSREPPVTLMTAHLRALGGRPQATVWGTRTRLSLVQAAYVNSVATHVLDFEPMWSPPTHAVSPTVPVAFALAESLGLSGIQVIVAVAKGLEIQGRLQYAGDQYVPEALKFHPPGVAGVIGSAVVAADLLGLDALTLQHALGIAASRAGALLANVGSMTKATHCGHAAASGLDAALLAARGFTANPDVFEAHKGLIDTYYPDRFDTERLLAYGKPWRVVDPGLAIKLFPSQYGTHYGITAGLELHRQLQGRSDISRVRMVSPVMKYVNRPQPATGLDGKFSLQYTTAAALLDGAVKIDTFTDERRFRSDMVGLLQKFELRQDQSIPGDFHAMYVEVEVELADGTRYKAVCRGPRGSWNAPMDEEDHQAKLDDCLRHGLPGKNGVALLAQLNRLDELDARGFRSLVKLMVVPASGGGTAAGGPKGRAVKKATSKKSAKPAKKRAAKKK